MADVQVAKSIAGKDQIKVRHIQAWETTLFKVLKKAIATEKFAYK